MTDFSLPIAPDKTPPTSDESAPNKYRNGMTVSKATEVARSAWHALKWRDAALLVIATLLVINLLASNTAAESAHDAAYSADQAASNSEETQGRLSDVEAELKRSADELQEMQRDIRKMTQASDDAAWQRRWQR